MKNKEPITKIITTSNIFSGIGASAAMCCAGPGIVGCGMSCASTCGSVGYSLFGFSSSAFLTWMGDYWIIFAVLSAISFSYAYYKIYHGKNCGDNKRSRILFTASLVGSVLLYAYSFLSC